MVTTVQESSPPYGALPAHANGRVLMHGVSWNTYINLRNDLGNSHRFKLAFDNGDLEIMSPLFRYEGSSHRINLLVNVLAEELGIRYQGAGMLTCNRKDLSKGIEPDCSYYIQHAEDVSGKDDLTFPEDPPPDLMVEIDITTSSLDKLPICAALGVPEHWRYDGNGLEIRILKGNDYEISEESAAFPGLPLAEVLPEYIRAGNRDLIAMTRDFRKWVRAQLKLKKRPRRSGKKK